MDTILSTTVKEANEIMFVKCSVSSSGTMCDKRLRATKGQGQTTSVQSAVT